MSIHQILSSLSYQFAGTERDGTPLCDLLHEETLRNVLLDLQKEIEAPSLNVTGSLFIKRYAFLKISSMVYLMSIENIGISVWEQAKFLVKEQCIYTKPTNIIEIPLGLDFSRAKKRAALFEQAFKQQLTPLIALVSKICRVSSKILWENVAVRIISAFRKASESNLNEMQKKHLQEDLLFLIEGKSDWIGLDENPLAPFLKSDHLATASVRTTCCMYYRTKQVQGDKTYCGNCPFKKCSS